MRKLRKKTITINKLGTVARINEGNKSAANKSKPAQKKRRGKAVSKRQAKRKVGDSDSIVVGTSVVSRNFVRNAVVTKVEHNWYWLETTDEPFAKLGPHKITEMEVQDASDN